MNPGRFITKFFRDDQHWKKMLFFQSVSIFHGLSTRQLGRVMQILQHRHYRDGEILFHEGQTGKAVFIIESGKVKLTRKTANGHSRTLGVLGPGQIFGEMALLDNLERTATATVTDDGVIHFLYTASLDKLMHQHPNTGVVILRNTASILSSLLRRMNKEFDFHQPDSEKS